VGARASIGPWALAADAMVAVSPSYAREILTLNMACGLEEFLALRTDTLHVFPQWFGCDSFNRVTTLHLGVNFDVDTLEKRF